jgi:hypothetical protein
MTIMSLLGFSITALASPNSRALGFELLTFAWLKVKGTPFCFLHNALTQHLPFETAQSHFYSLIGL